MSDKEHTFELTSWFPVISVKENNDNDLCAICRNFIFEKCLACLKTLPYNPNKTCNLEYNLHCTHLYHAHCIQHWNKTSMTCPNDALQWELCNKKQSGSLVKSDKESVKILAVEHNAKTKSKSKAKK